MSSHLASRNLAVTLAVARVVTSRKGWSHNLPQPIATTIYRIIQEALTNISKYAQASELVIEIQTFPTELKLQIIDNSCGFVVDNNTTGFGLQGMRERIISLQGKFEIISPPNTTSDLPYLSGCQIVAIIPLN